MFFGYLASGMSELLDVSWILISTFLVLSPEGGDAMELAVTRIKANLIGACTGFGIIIFDLPLIYSIASGAIIALVICELIKLSAGARATLAALVIVLMDQGEGQSWAAAFHRVISVFLGCIIGLLVTFFIHSVLKLKAPVDTDPSQEEKKSNVL